MNKFEELRKLAEEATPGPWYHCQPFQSVPKQRTIHGPVPAQRVDFVSTEMEPVHKKIVLPMQGREANIRSEDMAFIAAANPQTILALLDLVELQFRANHWAQQELVMWDHSEGGADFKYQESPCIDAINAFYKFKEQS